MTEYKEWLIEAQEFLNEARDDIGRGRYWLACFHAQQATELYLKGFLVRLTGSYPFTHSLVELLEAIEGLNYEISEEICTLGEALEKHYTRARYPGLGLSIYNERVARRCLSYAEKIIKYLEKLLKE